MGQTGNRGEWSELYAFLKLLSTGKLYAANNNMQNVYLPILKVIRKDNNNTHEYVINEKNKTIEIYSNAKLLRTIPESTLTGMANYFYMSIINSSNRAFEIKNSDKYMQMLLCNKISAVSKDKTDITMEVHDIYTGIDHECGFSIKSELGNSPTLLNASQATNFVFEILQLSAADAYEINKIDKGNKINERINAIYKKGGELKYIEPINNCFADNLKLIDSRMADIIAEMLLTFYRDNISKCIDIINEIENKDPLKYFRNGIYTYKLKKFLCAIALGMMPSVAWDGIDDANGGYVIVKKNGNIEAYHLYNRNLFEDYLLNNTRLEKASSTRHSFAKIYDDGNGKLCINLNLQIRFSN